MKLLVHRRGVAAACTACAVWVGLQVVSPAPTTGVDVVVAARNLPAGTVLTGEDLVTRTFAAGSEPAHLLDDAVGRSLAAPVTRGEALTETRVVSPGLTDHLDGRSGVPVRIEDPDVVQLLRVGDRVDVVAVEPMDGEHERVARDAVVLSLSADARGPGSGRATLAGEATRGRLVLLGVAADEADEVAAAAVSAELQVLWR